MGSDDVFLYCNIEKDDVFHPAWPRALGEVLHHIKLSPVGLVVQRDQSPARVFLLPHGQSAELNPAELNSAELSSVELNCATRPGPCNCKGSPPPPPPWPLSKRHYEQSTGPLSSYP